MMTTKMDKDNKGPAIILRNHAVNALLTLMLVAFACAFILPAKATADDGENLSATMRTSLFDIYSYPSRINYTSTASAPAYLHGQIDVYTVAYNGQELTVNLTNGTYTGLTPNTTYEGTVTIFHPDGSAEELSVGTVTTGDSSEGTFSATANTMIPLGDLGIYHVEFSLKSDGEEFTMGTDHSDNRYTFVIGGFDGLSASHLYVTDNQSVFNPHLQIITPEDARKGVEITRKATLAFLKPNTNYTMTDVLYEYTGDGQGVGRKAEFSKSFTTDSEGRAVIEYSLGEFSDLVPTHRYTMDSNVWQDGTTVSYGYDYRHIRALSSNSVIVLDEDSIPDDEGTQVDLTVNILDETDGSPLKGAKMRIVKGDDVNGETVASWTSDGTEKSFSLPLGKYLLIEDSAPSGYKAKPPTSFELTDDKALVRGYAFAAYTDYATVKNNFSFYEMYYHKYGETSSSELAYCINRGMNDPSPLDTDDLTRLFYKEQLVNSTELLDNVTNKTMTADELNGHVKRVIYNGHPTNASGIKEKYDLDDEEFRFITQQAVHHFTDGVNWSGDQLAGEKNYIDAYNDLISPDKTKEAPGDMILRVYIADNSNYQSLVSSEFKNGLGLELLLANAKEKDEPQEPDDNNDDDTAPDDSEPDDVTPDDGDTSDSGSTNDTKTTTGPETETGTDTGTATGDRSELGLFLFMLIGATLLIGIISGRRITSSNRR